MSKRKKKVLPTVLTVTAAIAGIMLIVFSFPAVSFAYQNMFRNPRIERSYNQWPIRAVVGISVDSNGNIYYGVDHGFGRASSIQVYSNEGIFLYGISFPTWTGMYFFYVDGDDIVRIFPARDGRTLSFRDGHLISSNQPIDSTERNTIIQHIRRQQARSGFTDTHGNTYTTNPTTITVRMYDPNGNFIRNIQPDAPTLPLPFSTSLFIAIAGLAIIVIASIRFFKVVFNKNRHD